MINSMAGVELPQIQLLELINEDPSCSFTLRLLHLPRTLKCLTLRGGVVQYGGMEECATLVKQLQV